MAARTVSSNFQTVYSENKNKKEYEWFINIVKILDIIVNANVLIYIYIYNVKKKKGLLITIITTARITQSKMNPITPFPVLGHQAKIYIYIFSLQV